MSAAARTSTRRGSGPHRQLSLISREAAPGDIEAIAALLFEAGGDALQFILDELAPGMSARALYRYMVGLEAGQYSYRRCLVAQRGCEIVGVVNAFPAELLRGELDYQPSPREAHVLGRDNQIDFGSYVINNLAVLEPYRRSGIAAHLIELTAETARSKGFASLQLQVWADNVPARALYARSGFVEVARTAVPWHPALPREGGRITLQRWLTAVTDKPSAAEVPGLGAPVGSSTALTVLLQT